MSPARSPPLASSTASHLILSVKSSPATVPRHSWSASNVNTPTPSPHSSTWRTLYRPSTGSFLSRDSYAGIADTPVSLNRYTYANNDPLSMFDPDEHCAIKINGNFCAGSLPKSKPKPPTPRNPGYHGSADSMERQANTNPQTNPGRSGSADGAARNAEIQEEKRRDLAVQRTVDAVAAAIERVIGSLDTALANYLGFGVTPSGQTSRQGSTSLWVRTWLRNHAILGHIMR